MAVPLDRIPPQSIEAEQATLGAMLISPAAIEKAAEILSQVGDLWGAAEALVTAGRLEQAAQAYTEAARIKPEHKQTLVNLGVVRQELGDMKGARECYERALRVAPDDPDILYNLATVLEQQGADQFFGEPALQLTDLMTRAPDGRGTINILAADQLMSNPRLYSTFLLWLLAELFEDLPEIGDPEQPKLVFFFDEAHLLFNEAPKALLAQVVGQTERAYGERSPEDLEAWRDAQLQALLAVLQPWEETATAGRHDASEKERWPRAGSPPA